MTTDKRPAVELQQVSKCFGDFRALDNISLAIHEAEFFSILGPSGCGKSTMLRLIAGLEHADSGKLMIGDRDMAEVPAYGRPCNMVFQNYAIFPHLSVGDNVAYGLRNAGLKKRALEEKIENMLNAVQLAGLEKRKPDQLSGGQRQRVALARALVREPKVLLLDEPLGALDKSLREQMQHELRELQQSVGITFILVTHDQEEALSMSDRIAVMSEGRILQIATPLDIYEQPNCSHVATFIGDMNFIDATTDDVQDDGSVEVIVPGFGRLRFNQRLPSERRGLAHRVAIRPEKLRISRQQTEAELCVSGLVVTSSYWGDQSQFQITVDGCDTPVTVAAHNVGQSGETPPARGERVWLSARPGAFLRFEN
ncbi:MAG TPA: ABC transporter ATP-binding protein [Woeseiaceae bacterium]|nr:ABC transporter ATP-binding protein [Woeseiaceae bacterium]